MISRDSDILNLIFTRRDCVSCCSHFLKSFRSTFLSGAESFRFVLWIASGQCEHDTYPQQKLFRNGL